MPTTDVAPTEKKKVFQGGKFLTFRLCDESYGIAVLKIREIIRLQKITPVPQMPHYTRGVINLRGKIIPVIDMRLKFALPKGIEDERTCIVVVQVNIRGDEQVSVGLIVDAVEEVTTISGDHIEKNPELGTTRKNEYIHGIAKIDQEVKTLLDIDKLIAEEDVVRM
ncbi:MAG: chemotaxis protein CheW [Verrucomicrobiota bacterium JB022]|nr:chemotaxis protein CheW [Verrucomicrobiota bacterium JB022]